NCVNNGGTIDPYTLPGAAVSDDCIQKPNCIKCTPGSTPSPTSEPVDPCSCAGGRCSPENYTQDSPPICPDGQVPESLDCIKEDCDPSLKTCYNGLCRPSNCTCENVCGYNSSPPACEPGYIPRTRSCDISDCAGDPLEPPISCYTGECIPAPPTPVPPTPPPPTPEPTYNPYCNCVQWCGYEDAPPTCPPDWTPEQLTCDVTECTGDPLDPPLNCYSGICIPPPTPTPPPPTPWPTVPPPPSPTPQPTTPDPARCTCSYWCNGSWSEIPPTCPNAGEIPQTELCDIQDCLGTINPFNITCYTGNCVPAPTPPPNPCSCAGRNCGYNFDAAPSCPAGFRPQSNNCTKSACDPVNLTCYNGQCEPIPTPILTPTRTPILPPT
ncbi:MAG: hypothetical protein EBU90_31050, partial [Proteobacteria bacterium]|nr:hypothetical protein [Pseudomonadota bacterium]